MPVKKNSKRRPNNSVANLYKTNTGNHENNDRKNGMQGGGKSNAAYPVTNSKYLYYFSRKESGRFEHPDNYFYFCGVLKRIILKSNNKLVW